MRFISITAVMAVFLVACGDDDGGTDGGRDGGPPPTDAGRDGGGMDSGMDGGDVDGGDTDGGPGDGGVDPIDRGEYLVNHVWTCNECHSPRDPGTGMFIAGRRLAGVDTLAVIPDPGGGPDLVIHTPNLTPDMDTGLGMWTDDQIRTALVDGMDIDGNNLHPIMPYWMISLLNDEDIDAIIAYLRSIPAVSNMVSEMAPFPVPVPVVPESAVPMPALETSDPLFDTAMRGRYLAGACMDCHTPDQMVAGMPPIDTTRAFGGGRVFPFPDPGGGPPLLIYSPNITQGMNGTDLDSIMLIQGLLTTSTEVCPPMPIGPDGYWGLTDEDAEAIATYIFHLPPIDSAAATPMCPLTPP